jgi:hypothetical protein
VGVVAVETNCVSNISLARENKYNISVTVPSPTANGGRNLLVTLYSLTARVKEALATTTP